MKKDKKNTEELLGQIKYDSGATSVIGADIAVLVAVSAIELIAGIFLNGYSVAADALHNIISAVFCVKLGKKIKKIFAAAMIPFSLAGVYFGFVLTTLKVSYLDRAPKIWLFMIIIPVLLLKTGFAINTADKIKLNGVRWLKPVSAQMNVCVLTAVASFVGLFSSFFISFYIEAAIATAVSLLSLIECFRVFGQFRAEYLEKVIENDTVKIEVEREPDEFAPISVGEIHLLSKSMGVDDTDEEPSKTETEKISGAVTVGEKNTEKEKKKTEKIFRDENRNDEDDDW